MSLFSSKPWEKVDRDVSRRYKICKKIGRGCFGVVWEVCKADPAPAESNELLALKKVLYAFRNGTDAQRTYREISYMLEFGHHDNILAVRDVLVSPNDIHLYFATDLLDSDLQKAMRCHAVQQVHKPLIAYQVMRALKYIHSAGVMHRDVKPSNILLRSTGEAVLADFGWARASPEQVAALAAPLTEYASTRWYRAPEILLGGRMYTIAVDMWAIACVVGEMHLDSPLIPGTSTLDMLTRIEEMVGKPLQHDIDAMETPYANLMLEAIPSGPPHKPIEYWMEGHDDDEELMDFLKLILQYSPEKRLTAAEALTHPYVGAFHNPDAEPEFVGEIRLAIPDDEKVQAARYRDQIYADVVGFNRSKHRVEDEERERLLHAPPDSKLFDADSAAHHV